MRALRLHTDGTDGLTLDEIEAPTLGADQALVRVHAAGLTRDELTWPTDRLPAIPSHELSGVVAEAAPDAGFAPGDPVFGLTAFDADGVAAELVAVPFTLLARKPAPLSHVEAAALPLAALSAWQALFDHGRLDAGERVLVTGAVGGVGHLATQLARWRGAHVVAATSPATAPIALEFGANETLDGATNEPFDLVFDTAGGRELVEAARRVRDGGRLVSVAEEPTDVPAGIDADYFIVEPNREQLATIAELAGRGELRPMIDSVFALEDARAAFDRTEARGKRGKVVFRLTEET